MAPTRVLFLGQSFIHRLYSFIVAHFGRDFVENFHLGDDLIFKWHGIGGRTSTVAKTRQFDLGVVESFTPDISDYSRYCHFAAWHQRLNGAICRRNGVRNRGSRPFVV